jgi:hypothetical protein
VLPGFAGCSCSDCCPICCFCTGCLIVEPIVTRLRSLLRLFAVISYRLSGRPKVARFPLLHLLFPSQAIRNLRVAHIVCQLLPPARLLCRRPQSYHHCCVSRRTGQVIKAAVPAELVRLFCCCAVASKCLPTANADIVHA